MSYPKIADMYVMVKRASLMGAGCVVLKSFADPM